MILDTSAIIAVLRLEPEADEFAELIAEAGRVAVSAATMLEASIVIGRERQRVLDEFVELAGAAIVAVDGDQLAVAREAHRRYGRGSGSPAKLTYGDCFSYALASTAQEPLLFKDTDFGHTDLVPAR